MFLSYECMLEKEELAILHQLRKELSLEKSYDAVPFISSVLQALRQTLNLEQATLLLNRLPDFLKVLFASNWKRNETQIHVTHLDEFVNLVMERDQQTKKILFKSEVQTLSVVILILKKMYNLIDIKNFEGLSPMFRQELIEASSEVAVA